MQEYGSGGSGSAAPHPLVEIVLNGPIDLPWTSRESPRREKFFPDAVTIIPAGASFVIVLREPAETLHVYLQKRRLPIFSVKQVSSRP